MSVDATINPHHTMLKQGLPQIQRQSCSIEVPMIIFIVEPIKD